MAILQHLYAHPALATKDAKRSLLIVSFLRALLLAIVALALNSLIELGTPLTVILTASVLGSLLAPLFAFSNRPYSIYFISLALLFASYRLLYYLLDLIPMQNSLLIFSLAQHCDLLFLVFAISSISTWFFWKFNTASTLETLLISSICIYLLSGHRNFHFDTPALINQLAWIFGLEHLSMLIALGLALLALCLTYLYFSNLAERPIAQIKASKVFLHQGFSSYLQKILAIGLFLLLISLLAQRIYNHYRVISLSVTANGVGEAQQSGLSPLGFHSALGSTNQPSALVRLEGDYASNPFSPMLYMRESALSEFNGHEMVLADNKYDADITRTRPEESFNGKEDAELMQRTPLIQSVFLLTEHDNAFAVDYPLSIVRLKNPDKARFKGSYRAYSVAPAFSSESAQQLSVGDSRWDQTTREHYLKPHSDPRYLQLATQLTEGLEDPVLKIKAIVHFLSKNAIYTLSPNHQVAKNDDPVAPFLFGDLRGYCVHFAHATVYMARALGIPARIGTGYLTDLSQSKDGHILLRMSDRHAWAEIFVAGLGWIPFDTQPEKVESHAESPVDLKLLEELMGLVGPGEEILPADLGKDEPALQGQERFQLPQTAQLLQALLVAVALLILCKIYLIFAWLLPGQPAKRLKKAYLSSLVRLHDLGFSRKMAETRSEFSTRVSQRLGANCLNLTQELSALSYSNSSVDIPKLHTHMKADRLSLNSIPPYKRWLSLLNPVSTFRFLFGAGW